MLTGGSENGLLIVLFESGVIASFDLTGEYIMDSMLLDVSLIGSLFDNWELFMAVVSVMICLAYTFQLDRSRNAILN